LPNGLSNNKAGNFLSCTMPVPKVSILLPVYNVSAYLGEAIRSILQQSFTDFELIILNDGSTDQTESVALSFSDQRIRYVKNEHNSGLIYTLNKGIDLATAEWIARMDGDDIADHQRIEKQWQYIQANPGIEVVATRVRLIDEHGEPNGRWKEDESVITPKQIRSFLPKNNCIAHPSIMISRELIKKYRYDKRQLHTEDYDLWLRLSADRVGIDKIDEPLLNHRIHTSSVTRKDQENVFFKLARTKFRFIAGECKNGKINGFVINTFLFAITDWIKGILKSIFSK
jgi:glycosyltransferase involved in cell wall biosynthesis